MIQCGYPPALDNGRLIEVTGFKVTDTAEYKCDHGFELSGPNTLNCQAAGEWTVMPACIFTAGMYVKYSEPHLEVHPHQHTWK